MKTSTVRQTSKVALAKRSQLNGVQWINLLKKSEAAKTPAQKKNWRRQAMRAFYGDNRGDKYA